MSIFDEQAIEAAAKALYKDDGPFVDSWEIIQTQRGSRGDVARYRKDARAALNAALASLRERGKLRGGFGRLQGKNTDSPRWSVEEEKFYSEDFPVAIIRLGDGS